METKEPCIAPGIEHHDEFLIAAHGYSCWVCRLCGRSTDEIEDSNP